MKINLSNIQTASAVPGAAAMIETFRAIGYSLELLLQILLTTLFLRRPEIYICQSCLERRRVCHTVKDDGCGMSCDEIK